MIKAVVLEIKDGHVAVLKEDGTVAKLKDKNFNIGEVVYMKEEKVAYQWRGNKVFSSIVAVAAMLCILVGAGAWAYDTPAYYISLDVNPGITMEVNLFEQVIDLEYVNDDAKNLLSDLDLKNKNVEDVIAKIIEQLSEAGYLTEEGNLVLTAIAKNEQKAEKLVEKLKNIAEVEADNNGVHPEVDANALGYYMVQEAKKLGITPGKLNIITNLLGEEVTDEYIDMSIRDLMIIYTATKGAEGKAKAEEAGKPEDAGKPDEAGKPEGFGKPEGVGKPNGTGSPAGAGKP